MRNRLFHIVMPGLFLALVLDANNLFSPVVLAQEEDELDFLVFEPVLLDAEGNPAVLENKPGDYSFSFEAGFPGILDSGEEVDSGKVEEDIAAYRREVADLESSDSIYSPELVEKLFSLGRIYQLQNNHIQAIEALERADQISRVNFGLYYPDQLPIIESTIDSYLAIGDIRNAIEKQRHLQYLTNMIAGHENENPLLSYAELADWNMEKFKQVLSSDPENSYLATGNVGSTMPSFTVVESYRLFAISSLFTARDTYYQAISNLVENDQDSQPLALDLAHKFLETIFLLGYSRELISDPHYYLSLAHYNANLPNNWSFMRRNSSGYETGLKTFEQIKKYVVNDPGSKPEDKVMSTIEFGDWHLMFGHLYPALDTYREAYKLGIDLGMEQAALEGLFSPVYPVHLPLITARPNSREKFDISDETVMDHDGYIDVSFSINRTGSAYSINILGSSPNTSVNLEHRLRKYLTNSPFRPAVVNGEPSGRDHILARYFYTYLNQ